MLFICPSATGKHDALPASLLRCNDRPKAVRSASCSNARPALAALAVAARCQRASCTARHAGLQDAEDPERVFSEAYSVEVQRIALLVERLEACGATISANQEFQADLEAVKQLSPSKPGDASKSWQTAFEAAKKMTDALEKLLQKARAGSSAAATESADPGTGKRGGDGSSKGSAKSTEPEEVKNLEDLAERVIEDENVLRFIAMPALGYVEGQELETKLPPVAQVRQSLGEDVFDIQSQVIFDRVYILTGQVASDTAPAASLATMRKRVAALSTSIELFLQPTMNSSQSALLVMLSDDMPSSEFMWWQWILCGFALVATVISVNFEAFTVSGLTSDQLAVVSINELPALARQTAPTAACILAVVAAKEVARRAAARKYGVVLTPPFLVPVWPIPSVGCFGAITRRLSIVPNEEANLAMSLSAGLTGYLVSLLLVLVGLAVGPDQDSPISLNYEPLPLVLKLLLRPFLGEPTATRQLDPFGDPVAVAFAANPIMIGGVVGFIITSLNLLCLGRLDGAILARSSLRGLGNFAGLLGFGVLLAGCFSNSGASYLYGLFGIYALVLQSGYDRPARDGISEPEKSFSLTATALLAMGILLSVPTSLASL